MTEDRFDRYRRLSERFGRDKVLALIDRLQVLALTHPDMLREMEDFLDRGHLPHVGPSAPKQQSPADR